MSTSSADRIPIIIWEKDTSPLGAPPGKFNAVIFDQRRSGLDEFLQSRGYEEASVEAQQFFTDYTPNDIRPAWFIIAHGESEEFRKNLRYRVITPRTKT